MNTIAFDIDVQGPDDSGCVNVVPTLAVDGAPVADFRVFALDLNELLRSRGNSGEHFLLTCWCGVPECARVDRGIRVRHEKGQVLWDAAFPVKAGALRFDAHAYGAAIEELLDRLPRFFAETQARFPDAQLVPYGCESYASVAASDTRKDRK